MEKVVYITGGTKGIGLGMAKVLLENGCRVAISGRNTEKAKEVAKQLGSTEKIIGIGADVRKYEDEVNAIGVVKSHFGKVDVIVANAGLGIFANIRELDIKDWHAMIDTNLTGVFHVAKAGVETLIESQGYFISIASLAGTNFFKGGSGYNASKFGVVGFTQAIMLDLRAEGVKVTTIMPGSVTSNFNNHQIDEEKDKWKIQPEDLGQMVVDLLKMNPRTLPSKIEVRPSKTADMI